LEACKRLLQKSTERSRRSLIWVKIALPNGRAISREFLISIKPLAMAVAQYV